MPIIYFSEFGKDWTQHGNIGNQNKIHEVIQASSAFYQQEKFWQDQQQVMARLFFIDWAGWMQIKTR
jgi:hypothetical protein